MKTENLAGIHLRSVDWFAWATGGGNSVVIFTNEVGVAEVLVTPTAAYVLTNRIERDRMADEEVPEEFELASFPWESVNAINDFVAKATDGGRVACDRPNGKQSSLPIAITELKLQLMPEELERYRKLGRGAAEAMTAALSQAQPDWTEQNLAGVGAQELWSRGYDPTLVMVGSEKRVQKHRHPIAKAERLGDYAMMVFCARGHGLYACFTRFIFFRPPTAEEQKRFDDVAAVEAAAFKASIAGKNLREVYADMKSAYERLGYNDEIGRHHQGGPTGYLSREFIAGPESDPSSRVLNRMALAWNPSLPGAKIEDTVLVQDGNLEILTVDPKWPTKTQFGRVRPDVWVR